MLHGMCGGVCIVCQCVYQLTYLCASKIKTMYNYDSAYNCNNDDSDCVMIISCFYFTVCVYVCLFFVKEI